VLYGIISDVHSNLEGLNAVLAELDREGVESILCCGDIIGYGADPGDCLELLLERGIRSIRGNHERGLADLEEGRLPQMNPLALEALHYSRDRLSRDQQELLISLPDHLEADGCFLVFHGSPADPDMYVLDEFEARYSFKSLRNEYGEPANRICFIGHTHVCTVFILLEDEEQMAGGTVVKPGRLDLPEEIWVMANVGSCGQYRGGRPQASFCVYDSDSRSLQFRFVDYDVAAAQEKIRQAGLPPELAERLAEGW